MNTNNTSKNNNYNNNNINQEIRIGILLFPGINCEEETKQAVESVGMKATIIKWTELFDKEIYQGYILPGGWSYEDRIRAGVIASHDPIMSILKQEAKRGKPILGICNGAQMLVEAGLVPGIQDNQVEFALAPNINKRVKGYYCTWIHIKLEEESAFVSREDVGKVIPLPIAHGEGQFITNDREILVKLIENKGVAARYCNVQGEIINDFPINPNGSIYNIAALTNKQKNVMAIMPHPERAAWKKQLPVKEHGVSYRYFMESGHGRLFFENMKKYIEAKAEDDDQNNKEVNYELY